MIHLLWPWIFFLLPLPLLVRRLMPPAPSSREGALYAPFILDLSLERAPVVDIPVNRFSWLFPMIIWLLLLTAAARPQWLSEPLEIPKKGRSLMLGVDVSESMSIRDMKLDNQSVDRLRVVKDVVAQFIERRQGDRVGLILFGDQAYLQTPLTFDLKSTAHFMQEAEIGIAGKYTAIGDAIGLAVKRMHKRLEKKQAVMILLTDGANTAGRISPKQAADIAAQVGLKIYTVGVGADRMIVNTVFGQRAVNPSLDLDEDTLKYIAGTTGGQYFRARERQELEKIYLRIDELVPEAGKPNVIRQVTPLFFYPLGAAFLLSLLYVLFSLFISDVKVREN